MKLADANRNYKGSCPTPNGHPRIKQGFQPGTMLLLSHPLKEEVLQQESILSAHLLGRRWESLDYLKLLATFLYMRICIFLGKEPTGTSKLRTGNRFSPSSPNAKLSQ